MAADEATSLRSRMAVNPLPEGVRRQLAHKLKVLMFLNLHSTQSLAVAAGLAPALVLAAESGAGELVLDDLEKIARVLGVEVVELFFSPGRTAAVQSFSPLYPSCSTSHPSAGIISTRGDDNASREEANMALEIVEVRYSADRQVFIDNEPSGFTNTLLYVATGSHRFHLGSPKDYRPGEIEQVIKNTSALEPAVVVFVRA